MACGCSSFVGRANLSSFSALQPLKRTPPASAKPTPCPPWGAAARSSSGRLICQNLGAYDVPHVAPVKNPFAQGVRFGEEGGRKQRLNRMRVESDEFELEDEEDFEIDRPELGEDEEDDIRDYETEYESMNGYTPMQRESDTFMSTEGGEEETVVDWKINEEEFHKLTLFNCDFFIRKVADPDDDVYDFREMYVTPPDTDVYSIPKVVGTMPKKPVRCAASKYEYIHTSEPPVDQPRAPLYKTEMECMKVFLIRHLKDRRTDNDKFILDFEEIYVVDSKTKSITRAEVKVEVTGGKNRDRSQEVLIVRDDGTSFKIIPEEDQMSPDEVIQSAQWDKTREAMENYLRGFRDYETSNWF